MKTAIEKDVLEDIAQFKKKRNRENKKENKRLLKEELTQLRNDYDAAIALAADDDTKISDAVALKTELDSKLNFFMATYPNDDTN